MTSSPRHIVEKALAKLDIHSYFQTIVTYEDVENIKPHPEPVLLALKQLDCIAAETIMIGDSINDILAGQAAGIKTGLFFPAIHNRFYDYNKLLNSEPHFVFNEYGQLSQHLYRVPSLSASEKG